MGLCYSGGCLYVAEWQRTKSCPRKYSFFLAAHLVQGDSGEITPLDRLELWTNRGDLTLLELDRLERWASACPRVERHSQQVFVPCRGSGVVVAHLDGDRLVRKRTLACVKKACSVDVMSQDTVYVCDYDTKRVCVVDVRDDSITSMLETPDKVRHDLPNSLAVLGSSVMVGYKYGTVVVYHHGSLAPVRVISHIGELDCVSAVSTDCQQHFLVTDSFSKFVYILDASGNVRHQIKMVYDTWVRPHPVDCAVVNKELWVGSLNGYIIITSLL